MGNKGYAEFFFWGGGGGRQTRVLWGDVEMANRQQHKHEQNGRKLINLRLSTWSQPEAKRILADGDKATLFIDSNTSIRLIKPY